MKPYAALRPHRHFAHHAEDALQEDERRLAADAAARLVSLRDEPMRAGCDGRSRLFDRGDFGQHRAVAPPRDARGIVDDDDARPLRESGDFDSVRDAHAEARQPPRQLVHGRGSGLRVATDVDDAERSRSRQRHHEPGVRTLERRNSYNGLDVVHLQARLTPPDGLNPYHAAGTGGMRHHG